MNRYIVVNTKAKNSAVWETIGDNYTPSKGEVCIVVPPTSEITKDEKAVRTSLIEQHYFSSDEKEAILALINNEEVLTEEQKKSDKFNILFQNIKHIENKITHFNENGRTISIIKEDNTTESKYIGPFTVDERTYLLYKLNNKINNFTKQFALHNFEGTINSLVIDDTNNNFINITLKEHNSITFKVLNDNFKYKNVSIGNTKIRLIPSIEVDYYETELLPSTCNINKDIQSGKEKLIEKINSIPKTEDFESTDPNSPEIRYYAPGATLFTDTGDGNIVVSTENIDYTGVAPISIKIGDGTTIFRDLPTLTTGNVQGDWTAADPTNPSYIKNKPILNDDLFYQSKEKTLLIPSNNYYDDKDNLVIQGLLDLFNINYLSPNGRRDNALTPQEKSTLIYIVQANGYDLKDITKLDTKLFTNIEKEKAEDKKTIGQKNREIVKTKLRNYYEVQTDNVELIAKYYNYLIELIDYGTTAIDLQQDTKDLLLIELNKIITTEDIDTVQDITISPKNINNIKTFNNQEYIKISDKYFHPNDLLIYNDNNWGYYEIHMYGLSSIPPFYDNEINYLKYLINYSETNLSNETITYKLDRDKYLAYTKDLQTLLKFKINNFITNGQYKNYFFNKMEFIVPDALNNEETLNKLINNINEKIKEYNNKQNEEANKIEELNITDATTIYTKINWLINYINNDMPITITEDLPDDEKKKLVKLITTKNINTLEINKQPRFWFYKSNILKTKEKQTLNQIINDTLYVYNNRFNAEEQSILTNIITGNRLTDEQYLKLRQGLSTSLIKKIQNNTDITIFNGKKFLIERLQLNNNNKYIYKLNADDLAQLLNQVEISRNNLTNQLNNNEMKEMSEEILEDLIKTLALDKENTIIEGINGTNIYYEINNEIILDSKDRAIYMRLANLIGYLKQTRNLEIIFHYKTRSVNSAFLSDFNGNWNENDPEQPGYIYKRMVYKDDDGKVACEKWFSDWLVDQIELTINNWILNNLEGRIKKIEQDIIDIKAEIATLKEKIEQIEKNNQDEHLLNRIQTLIVSQPNKPELSKEFFPKIWICTDDASGYGLVYWRSGGEDAKGEYDMSLAQNIKWIPISSIWSPDILNN